MSDVEVIGGLDGAYVPRIGSLSKTSDGRIYGAGAGPPASGRPSLYEVELFNREAEEREAGWALVKLFPSFHEGPHVQDVKWKHPVLFRVFLWYVRYKKNHTVVNVFSPHTSESVAKYLEYRDYMRAERDTRRLWLESPVIRARVAQRDARETEEQYAETVLPVTDYRKVDKYVRWKTRWYGQRLRQWAHERYYNSTMQNTTRQTFWRHVKPVLAFILKYTRAPELTTLDKVAAGVLLGQVKRDWRHGG